MELLGLAFPAPTYRWLFGDAAPCAQTVIVKPHDLQSMMRTLFFRLFGLSAFLLLLLIISVPLTVRKTKPLRQVSLSDPSKHCYWSIGRVRARVERFLLSSDFNGLQTSFVLSIFRDDTISIKTRVSRLLVRLHSLNGAIVMFMATMGLVLTLHLDEEHENRHHLTGKVLGMVCGHALMLCQQWISAKRLVIYAQAGVGVYAFIASYYSVSVHPLLYGSATVLGLAPAAWATEVVQKGSPGFGCTIVKLGLLVGTALGTLFTMSLRYWFGNELVMSLLVLCVTIGPIFTLVYWPEAAHGHDRCNHCSNCKANPAANPVETVRPEVVTSNCSLVCIEIVHALLIAAVYISYSDMVVAIKNCAFEEREFTTTFNVKDGFSWFNTYESIEQYYIKSLMAATMGGACLAACCAADWDGDLLPQKEDCHTKADIVVLDSRGDPPGGPRLVLPGRQPPKIARYETVHIDDWEPMTVEEQELKISYKARIKDYLMYDFQSCVTPARQVTNNELRRSQCYDSKMALLSLCILVACGSLATMTQNTILLVAGVALQLMCHGCASIVTENLRLRYCNNPYVYITYGVRSAIIVFFLVPFWCVEWIQKSCIHYSFTLSMLASFACAHLIRFERRHVRRRFTLI